MTREQSPDDGAESPVGEAPAWTRERAAALAREALAMTGHAGASVSLLTFRGTGAGSEGLNGPRPGEGPAHVRVPHATLRVERPSLLIKIAGSAWGRQVLDRSLAVGAWLSEAGFPVAAPAAETSGGALQVGECWVGLWRWEDHDPERRLDPGAVGELLRRLHEVLERCPVALPNFDSTGRMRRRVKRLAEGGRLDASSSEFLASRVDQIAGRCERFQGELGVGPIHGDFALSNVLATRAGPLLVDLDNCSLAPREWDLAPLSLVHANGWNEDEWPAFAAGYGYDLLADHRSDPLREQAYARVLVRWLGSRWAGRSEQAKKLLEEWRREPGKALWELDWEGA